MSRTKCSAPWCSCKKQISTTVYEQKLTEFRFPRIVYCCNYSGTIGRTVVLCNTCVSVSVFRKFFFFLFYPRGWLFHANLQRAADCNWVMFYLKRKILAVCIENKEIMRFSCGRYGESLWSKFRVSSPLFRMLLWFWTHLSNRNILLELGNMGNNRDRTVDH